MITKQICMDCGKAIGCNSGVCGRCDNICEGEVWDLQYSICDKCKGGNMQQVLITLCLICKIKSLNCYDSEREPKKIYCLNCNEISCPIPTERFSHGFCDQHFQGRLEELQRRKANET